MKTPHSLVAGKRKRAVAKVKLVSGNGTILFKGVPHVHLYVFHKLALEEPVQIYRHVFNEFPYDISITASGGGKEGQIQAARLAIAKALLQHTKSIDLKKAFLQYDRNLLVADIRRKETYKPGDSKARAKRQKSYR